jgi:hypothetical protein
MSLDIQKVNSSAGSPEQKSLAPRCHPHQRPVLHLISHSMLHIPQHRKVWIIIVVCNKDSDSAISPTSDSTLSPIQTSLTVCCSLHQEVWFHIVSHTEEYYSNLSCRSHRGVRLHAVPYASEYDSTLPSTLGSHNFKIYFWISWQIQDHTCMQKNISVYIRGLGGLDLKKTRGEKISCYCLFNKIQLMINIHQAV